MNITTLIRWACVPLAFACGLSAQANSIGLFSGFLVGTNLQIDVDYDFTEFAMFGGGANIVYDTNVLEFVSYTRADLPSDAQGPASPIGGLDSPGLYTGFGVGTFDFFNGMTSAGTIGTFVFNVIGDPSGNFMGCGGDDFDAILQGSICVTPNVENPFVSLAGNIVDVDIFTGPGAYIPPENPVPVPGAVWLFVSALGAMIGLRKKG